MAGKNKASQPAFVVEALKERERLVVEHNDAVKKVKKAYAQATSDLDDALSEYEQTLDTEESDMNDVTNDATQGIDAIEEMLQVLGVTMPKLPPLLNHPDKPDVPSFEHPDFENE